MTAPTPSGRAQWAQGPIGHSRPIGTVGAGAVAASPVWFGPPERSLFGWFHAPGRARAGAVLCPPLGHEYTQTHGTFRRLAEELAARQVAALRFDYDGTGDSAGDNADPSRVHLWLRSIAEAVDFVRAAGCARVSLIGMRMGAVLASYAAAEDGQIDQLVLWDPTRSGRHFLREQQALTAVSLGAPGKLVDGAVQAPGALYSPDTVHDLEALRLDAIEGPAARRVLVLTRSNAVHGRDLASTLGRESVLHEEATGQAALMDVAPPRQKIPHAAVERIGEWLADGSGELTAPVQIPDCADSSTVGYDDLGRPIVERSFFIEPAGLYGIITSVDGATAPGTPALFLSAANDHHVGPNRLWVDLARRWAKYGIRSLRFDLSGLGDSPVRRSDQEPGVTLAPESFSDIADAARAISPNDPRRVFLVGVCSGAYQAVDSGIDLRPRGVVAINPVFVFVPPELRSGRTVEPRRKAFVAAGATGLIYSENAVMSALRRRFPGWGRRIKFSALPLIRLFWWFQRSLGRAKAPSVWLRNLARSGTDVLMVAGELESRPIRFGASKRLWETMTSSEGFRWEYIPDLEHSLMVASHREQISDLVTEHVLMRFAPPAGASDDLVRTAHMYQTARSVTLRGQGFTPGE